MVPDKGERVSAVDQQSKTKRKHVNKIKQVSDETDPRKLTRLSRSSRMRLVIEPSGSLYKKSFGNLEQERRIKNLHIGTDNRNADESIVHALIIQNRRWSIVLEND